jgi:hypothetical protein
MVGQRWPERGYSESLDQKFETIMTRLGFRFRSMKLPSWQIVISRLSHLGCLVKSVLNHLANFVVPTMELTVELFYTMRKAAHASLRAPFARVPSRLRL